MIQTWGFRMTTDTDRLRALTVFACVVAVVVILFGFLSKVM